MTSLLLLIILANPGAGVVDAGSNHFAACDPDGAVWVWGFGQGPERLRGQGEAYSVAAGGTTTYVITEDGSVWASEFAEGRPGPVAKVFGLDDIMLVSAGSGHALALKADGTVYAWGRNDAGQLGDGTREERRSPVAVAGLAKIVNIAAGGHTSMAVDESGAIWGWGDNRFGQIGDGSLEQRLRPVRVSGPGDPIAIALGENHALAVDFHGEVWEWGRGTEDGVRNRPVKTGTTGGITVAATATHSIVVKYDGSIWTWPREGAPRKLETAEPAFAVAAGGGNMVALMGDGGAMVWNFQAAPARVSGLPSLLDGIGATLGLSARP